MEDHHPEIWLSRVWMAATRDFVLLSEELIKL